MKQKDRIRILLALSLCFISLGGWLLHIRIHPPAERWENYIPFFMGGLSSLIIPLMYFYRKTLHWAYVLNGMTVIIGAIVMAHFSLVSLPDPATLGAVLLKTTFPDIVILACKFTVGVALFELTVLSDCQVPARQGRYWRYPNLGWWWVHFLAMSLVYALGALIWK